MIGTKPRCANCRRGKCQQSRNICMTCFSLLLRNLAYFRRSNLAVMGGMTVATAVLTGAMMVGDSVRESLRVLAVQRLGRLDHALVANRFFDQGLAQRVAGSTQCDTRVQT